MRRIFADSSVLIAGADSQSGASNAVIVMAEIGLYKLVVTRQVLDECEHNLRKKLPAGLPTFARLMRNMNLVIADEVPTTDVTHWSAHIEAKDAPILAAALQADVDRLLTLNTRHFTPRIAQISGLQTQLPSEFVQEVRAVVTEWLV